MLSTVFTVYIPFRVKPAPALSEEPVVHQQPHDTDISTDNSTYETLEPDMTLDNHGWTQTETSHRQYQTALPDLHYDYPYLTEITRGNNDTPTARDPPALPHTDNAREYLELTDDINGQQNIGMPREYLELTDDSNAQQNIGMTREYLELTDDNNGQQNIGNIGMTREYLELTDNSNGQHNIDMTREYLEIIDNGNGQQKIDMTTTGDPEYDDVVSPGSQILTDDDMVLTDNQMYLPANFSGK